jgi:hypothetical protein
MSWNQSIWFIVFLFGVFYGRFVYQGMLWSFGIFCDRLVYFVIVWYILWSFGITLWSFGITLWSFGIFSDHHLVHFAIIYYIMWSFGTYFPSLECSTPEKSGNPGPTASERPTVKFQVAFSQFLYGAVQLVKGTSPTFYGFSFSGHRSINAVFRTAIASLLAWKLFYSWRGRYLHNPTDISENFVVRHLKVSYDTIFTDGITPIFIRTTQSVGVQIDLTGGTNSESVHTYIHTLYVHDVYIHR